MNGPAALRYVVITPVRDEAAHVEGTIRSMLQQTIRPAQWVIVDDGSSDGTSAIVERHAAQNPWITALIRPRTGPRQNASAVMEAFYYGFDRVEKSDWEYLVKLDGDVTFEPAYFERCFEHFSAVDKLGIGGGIIWNSIHGALEPEPCPANHVRGATKIYRRKCWDAIGGLLRTPGWDTVDEVKASMLGWKVQTFRQIQVLHYRPTGAAEGAWRNAVKDGRADYVTGYHPLFMLLKCAKRLAQKPFVIGSLGLLYGFLGGWLAGAPQVDDRAMIKYLRRQQLRRLLLLEGDGK